MRAGAAATAVMYGSDHVSAEVTRRPESVSTFAYYCTPATPKFVSKRLPDRRSNHRGERQALVGASSKTAGKGPAEACSFEYGVR